MRISHISGVGYKRILVSVFSAVFISASVGLLEMLIESLILLN